MYIKNTEANWDQIDRLLFTHFQNQDADSITHLEKHVSIDIIKNAVDNDILKKSVDPYGREIYELTSPGLKRRDEIL